MRANSNPALLSTGLAPTITTAVGSHTTNQGSDFTLSVTATNNGTATLNYQWRPSGSTLLSGQTSSTLLVSDPQTANAGAYSVLVSTIYGNVTSTGNLTVIQLPVITSQPVASNAVIANKATSFKVTATGSPTLTYQWQSSIEQRRHQLQ